MLTFTLLLPIDASDGPQRGHSSHPPPLETEPLHRRRPPVPVHLGSGVDGGSGHLVGLGPPPHTVETLRCLSHPHAEGLHLTVGQML